MSKPTYDELVEALRYFVGQGCMDNDYYPDYRQYKCLICGGYLGEPCQLPPYETVGHESYCEFAKAEALLARLDAKEPA